MEEKYIVPEIENDMAWYVRLDGWLAGARGGGDPGHVIPSHLFDFLERLGTYDIESQMDCLDLLHCISRGQSRALAERMRKNASDDPEEPPA